MTDYRLAFAPLIPLWALGTLSLAALLAIALGARARPLAALLRAVAVALVALALADPSLVRERRTPLDDVVAVVVDRSASQTFEKRSEQTDAARALLEERLKGLGGVEIRVIEAAERADDGTRLFDALAAGLSDVPPERVGAVFMITDGVVHDVPEKVDQLGFKAPLHALITGREGERDRRVELIEAPRFGIVGKEAILVARLREYGAASPEPVSLSVRRDGELVAALTARPDETIRLPVKIEHAGANVIEVEAAPVDGEVTSVNNKAVVTLEGVRDKLKVLLVSGEPHGGERMWRNLLKADPNVDLVHFTILRPPEKNDGTPISELALIAFPTAELFDKKIGEFDLIIFDRYANQTILPTVYLDNIVRYVREGGALMVAAGPDFASTDGLFYSPLGAVMPAKPTGEVAETPFRPELTAIGRKHPVTRDLPGSQTNPPQWAPWRRVMIAAARRDALSLLSAPKDAPLLTLSRERKGRVGLLTSDQMWLWARGFEGGGPHLDLLRRAAHWLMKEPDLEEEALRARAKGGEILVERQSVKEAARRATATGPTGVAQTVALEPAEPGLARGRLIARSFGLHRVTDGELTALVNVGPDNPREFQDVVSTPDRLAPLATATGGSARRIGAADGAVALPRLAALRQAPIYGGADYLAIRRTQSSLIEGVSSTPVGLGLWALAALLGAVAAAWLSEGWLSEGWRRAGRSDR